MKNQHLETDAAVKKLLTATKIEILYPTENTVKIRGEVEGRIVEFVATRHTGDVKYQLEDVKYDAGTVYTQFDCDCYVNSKKAFGNFQVNVDKLRYYISAIRIKELQLNKGGFDETDAYNFLNA